jgi:hypothetical protein
MKSRHTPRAGYFGILILFLSTLALGTSVAAQGDWKPTKHPTLDLHRSEGAIQLDGALDDGGWRNAARAGNFVEHNPGNETRPPVETAVLVTYDDRNLYVAFICADDPAKVRTSVCERDRIFSDDNVGIILDTYGDAAWAYELMINPYGIQGDLLFSPEGGEDEGYNMVWESAGQITDSGYQVEVAVPFASLRFPTTDQQSWRIDFWRNHPREIRRQYSWAEYDNDDPCWPCRWGTINGIEHVTPGKGIEILPSVIGYQSGVRDEPTGRINNDNPDGQLSLNSKYAISSGVTAEATINPDFSQIESDAAQIDVNSTFALDYPERRPFFQEGSDLFLTPFRTVYTRMINDPQAAVKLIGRVNRLSVGYLSAYDEHSPIVIPFEEYSRSVPSNRSPKSFSNILRARRAVGTDSYVGLVATDRHLDGGGSSALAGIDGEIRFWKSYKFRWQTLATLTEEPHDSAMSASFGDIRFDNGRHSAAFDGESFTGHAFHVLVQREARHFSSTVYYSERSPTFRADNGFEPSNDQRKLEAEANYWSYPEHGLLTGWAPDVTLYRQWNFDGQRKIEYVTLELDGNFRLAQLQLAAAVNWGNERYSGIWFERVWQSALSMNARPNDMMALGAEVRYGHQIARGARIMGREIVFEPSVDLKLNNRMLLENGFQYAKSRDLDTDARLYRQSVVRSRLTYQFTRRLSARAVVQYAESRDWTDSSASRNWEIDPLLTYRLNSFSMVYLGSTHNYDDLAANADASVKQKAEWALTSRQYFLKVQYLFQL